MNTSSELDRAPGSPDGETPFGLSRIWHLGARTDDRSSVIRRSDGPIDGILSRRRTLKVLGQRPIAEITSITRVARRLLFSASSRHEAAAKELSMIDEHRDELARILDLPLSIHVELGRRRVRIAEVLELGVGAVLELDVAAGAPLSIYANGVLVAQGEAVVVGERYGLRITEIISPEERVRRLGARGGL